MELIHHIRMAIMDMYTFHGMQRFFTKHSQDKRYVLISLKYRHCFLLMSRWQFRAHDKVIIIIVSKDLKF